MFHLRWTRTMLACALAVAAGAVGSTAVFAEEVVQSRTVSFKVGMEQEIDVRLAGLRATRITVEPDNTPLLRQVLPEAGGRSRFSWLRYGVWIENPGESNRKVRCWIRLLDKDSAIIDEFYFTERISSRRAESVDINRLTLNYVLPMVHEVELTLATEQ